MSEHEPPDGLSEVLITARAAVDQEFLISQRLDAKAQALVVVAGQWFAITQAVSAIAYATTDARDWLLYTVAGAAVTGAVALGATFYFCWLVWMVRDEPAVSPRGLMQMKTSANPALLIDHYASILQDRRATNRQRAKALEVAQLLWFAALAVPLLQLGFALATRLFA